MKFLKHLFTVPKGKKISEGDMKRVLASSICGILLCMSCLFSTTWAWYKISVDSKPVSIQVADHKALPSEVEVAANETKEVTVYFKTDAKPSKDSLSQFAAKRYIVADVYRVPETALTETQTEQQTDKYSQKVGKYYFQANKLQVTESGEELYYEVFTLSSGAECRVTFSTAWHIPESARILNAYEGVTVPERYAFEIIPIVVNEDPDSKEESQSQETQEQEDSAPSEPVEVPTPEPLAPQAVPAEDGAPAETTAPVATTAPVSE